jgi:hypothetical protein
MFIKFKIFSANYKYQTLKKYQRGLVFPGGAIKVVKGRHKGKGLQFSGWFRQVSFILQ